ncbi:UDP-2,3-diacylglucosamine diphosphatase [Caminibacter sp.]
MKIKEVSLKDGAVLIADVHYKRGDKHFLELLKSWIKNPPPQVFFLGDIFHLLLDFDFLKKYNKEAIELINTLSQKTKVYYTPGNHDFNIENIFSNVTFADAFVDNEKSVFLTHGDLTDSDFFYRIYVRIIRNKLLLNILNIITLNFKNSWLLKKILQKKIKCLKISGFRVKVFSKIADINYKKIIEGHYHQGVEYDFEDKTYFNLGAYVCDKVFYVYKDNTLKAEYGDRRQNFKGRFKRT